MPKEIPWKCMDCGDTDKLYFNDDGELKCPECHSEDMICEEYEEGDPCQDCT